MTKRINLFGVLIAAALLMASCGEDDEKPKNQMSVDGENYSLVKGYIVSEEQEDEEGEETGIYIHQVILTGEGLELSDGPEFDGSADVASFAVMTESDELEAGEYDIKQMPDDEGEASYAIVYTDYSQDEGGVDFDQLFGGIDGTIKISRSGDTYTINVNATEVVEQEGAELEDIEGKLTVRFKGALEPIDVEDEEPVRKPSAGSAKLFDFILK